jgi:hypothetical protein
MTNLRRLLILVALLLGSSLQCVYSETTKDNEDADEDPEVIRIVGYSDGSTQRLPTQYVLQSFSRWILLENSLERITSTDDEGFVNPSSITDLWWPVDIGKIQMRPSLDVVLQHGTPKYVASGLDVRVPTDDKDWRNHGMNSQPLARQWTLFENVAKPNFRVEGFVEVIGGEDEADSGSDEERQWEHLLSSSVESTREAIEKLGVLLSGLDESSPLSQGYHIVSIPTTETWADLPVMETVIDKPYMVVCFGTILPDARALLDTKPYVAARVGISILAVQVSPTAPGRESQHLPEAYRALYQA